MNINNNQINTNINNRYTNINNRPFTPGWRPPHAAHLPARPWHGHHRPGRPGYRPGHWWRWGTTAAVTGWLVGRWGSPVYYGYGSGGNVYYEGDTVYVNGEASCTSEEYYDQAEQIAEAAPEWTDDQAEKVEWLPLGVYAVTQEGTNDSNMLLQLAVTKEGVIGGTLFNESTEATRAVEGTVDKKTQRAAWTFADGKNTDTVMETGIYNLTENQCTALVHLHEIRAKQHTPPMAFDEPQCEPRMACQGVVSGARGAG